MKKAFSLLLATLLFSTMMLSACGQKETPSGSGSDPSTGPGNTDPSGDENINVEYTEPTVTGENYKWIDEKAPILQFEKPADTIVTFDAQERTMSDDIRQLLSSLKAVVNGKEVRLFIPDNNTDMGTMHWLDDLEYRKNSTVKDMTDPWDVVKYFKDEIQDVVLYETNVMETLDLACTYAGIHDCLALSFPMYAQLVERGYNVKIVEDYRGRFKDKYDAYEYLYKELWPQCTHRILISEHIDYVGYVRSFGMLIKAASLWLDVRKAEDEALMKKFLADMPAGQACIYGWYESEDAGVEIASKYGVWTYAADWLQNIEFFAHETEIVPPERLVQTFTKPEDVDNKTVYVAMALSEGDNLTYDETQLYNIVFQDPKFGEYPLSLSMSPTSAVMMPEIMNWYYEHSNANIGYMTGPSGVGYTYTNEWEDEHLDALEQYFETTNKYCKLAGIEVVNNWTVSSLKNWNQQDISDPVRALMEKKYTDILAVIDQGSLTRETFSNGLAISPMQIGYTAATADIKNQFKTQITKAGALTARSEEPSFVYLQGNPWSHTAVSDLYSLYNEMKGKQTAKDGEYTVKFVRVDECARAQRLYNGLSAKRGE